MPRPGASLLLVAMLITGCGASPEPPAASPPTGGLGTSSPTANSTVMSPTPSLSAAPTTTPSPVTTPALSSVFRGLPLRRSAWAGDGPRIGLTPGPDGTVAVSIYRDKGAVLVLYDTRGRPRPGWPIEVPHSTWCDVVGFAIDGSLRAVCDAPDLVDGSGMTDDRVFAFDPDGRVLDGWPVQIPEGYSTRVVGDDLMRLVERSVGEGEWNGIDPAQVLSRSWLVRVGADGTIATGEPSSLTATECWGVDWVIGPDGIAYGASESWDPPGACFEDVRTRETIRPSRMHALGDHGFLDGWPIPIDGALSSPVFGPDGTIVVTAGIYDRRDTRIQALDPRTRRIVATSPRLRILSASTRIDVDCNSWPETPLVAADGTVYLIYFPTIYAFDAALRRLPGWPVDVSGDLASAEPPGFDGLDCGWGLEPVTGSNGTLYLSLEPTSKSRGGRLDAIAKTGKRPAGWPVRLNRAGSTFWDVAVGDDGTVYALAVEPEGKKKASATLLAIDPDSDVRYAVTLLEP
jgi:hypothetical protein